MSKALQGKSHPISNEQKAFLKDLWAGSKSPRAKLTEIQVNTIRAKRIKGAGLKELAFQFHVSEATVSRVCNRITHIALNP